MANEKRLIYANELQDKLQAHHDLFVNAWGGFRNLPPKDKARVDEITHCIAEVVNAPTVDAIVPPVKIGQVLWCNIPHSEFPLECRVYCLCREAINGLVLDYFRCTVKGWFAKAFSFEDVGKTIFQTREEAEAAIEERKDNE